MNWTAFFGVLAGVGLILAWVWFWMTIADWVERRTNSDWLAVVALVLGIFGLPCAIVAGVAG